MRNKTSSLIDLKDKTMRRNTLSLLRYTRTVRISVILIFIITGCSSHDFWLEYKTSKKLDEFKKNNATWINLNETFGNDWKKICLQWTYGLKDALEKSFDEILPEEVALGPNDNALWVFYNDGSAKVVVISRKVMDYQYFPHIGTLCTSSQKPYLYAIESYGEKRFYFFNK